MEGVQPVYEVNKDEKSTWSGAAGWLGGGLIGYLIGQGGLGGLGGGNNAVGLTNEMLALRMQDNMTAGFAGVNSGINNINLQMCQGFGGLTHQIDIGNCRLETAIHAEGEATRALITENRIRQLESENNALRLEANNSNQTNTIINAVRPYPIQSVPFTPYGAPCYNHGFNY